MANQKPESRAHLCCLTSLPTLNTQPSHFSFLYPFFFFETVYNVAQVGLELAYVDQVTFKLQLLPLPSKCE